MEQKQYDEALEEKKRVEQLLVSALEDAAIAYKKVLNASEEKRKNTLECSFFQALFAAEGILENKEKQNILRMYVPMLVLAEEDGAYFFYLEETGSGLIQEIRHVWSEKIFYNYAEGGTEQEKRNAIAALLENKASEIVTAHNYIALQYGLDYSFYVPEFLQNTASCPEFPMIFVVIQGWPLLASGKITYENCIDAGAFIQDVQKVTVTAPENLEHPEYRYHLNTCTILLEEVRVSSESINREEAILNYGAIPCEKCILGQ